MCVATKNYVKLCLFFEICKRLFCVMPVTDVSFADKRSMVRMGGPDHVSSFSVHILFYK